VCKPEGKRLHDRPRRRQKDFRTYYLKRSDECLNVVGVVWGWPVASYTV
jgi:hypothetical protein